MGRTGITQLDVSNAAETLLNADPDRGMKGVTIDRVRQQLGNEGSKTTISKYLNAWKAGSPDAVTTGLPGTVLDAMQTAFKDLKLAANAKALQLEESFDEERATLKNALSDRDTKLSEAVKVRTNLQREETRLQKELSGAKDLAAMFEKQLGDKTSDCELIQTRLDERDRQVNELKTQITQLHQQRQHTEESLQAKHQDERADYQADIQTLKKEIKAFNDQQSTLMANNQSINALLKAAQQQNADLKAEKTTLSKQSMALEKKISKTAAQLSAESLKTAQLGAENKEAFESITVLERDNATLKNENSSLQKISNKQDEELQQLNDQLSIAIGEKGVLQGQCRQLEKLLSSKSQGTN